jgi:hypothetical protein
LKKNREAGQLTLAGTEEGEILARLSERVEKAVQTIQELRRAMLCALASTRARSSCMSRARFPPA